ncbi:retention module-containing protein [Oceanimonas sp. MB9]|uniref:retention module-containing protein n=1 Tax=Oceanimonas sp. MB9 TaxID=2588453 RepID=UPI0013F59D3F|nr:retention module-containing protein [Oceanimonas sp. MB9]NHI01412.1 Serralysin A [Oceanimonas sp. MB9]
MKTTKIESTVQVVSLKGQAFIISQNGTVTPVSAGQVIPAGTLLLTDENSGIVYGDAPENAMSAQPAVNETAAEEAEAIQAAILAGLDPTKLFAAPAAGNPASGQVNADGSGNAGFVVVDRTGDALLAEAGFDTTFASQPFDFVIEALPERNLDDSIPVLVVVIDPPLTPPGDGGGNGGNNTAFVEESALPNGSNPDSDNESCTGYFDINTGNDELARVEIRLPGGEWVDVTGGGVIEGKYGTLTVTVEDGVYRWRYDLNGAVDHPNEGETGADDTLPDDFEIRVTDDDGDQATAGLTVNVHDDGPMAEADSFTVGESGKPCYNLMLIIDTSGSMEGERLALAKQALINLINSYRDISSKLNISVIDFGTQTKMVLADMTADEAIAHINSLTAEGWTNYQDPLEDAQELLTEQVADKPEYEHKVYFISDGEPNRGDVPEGWQGFVDDNGIDVIAVGVGENSPEARDELDKVGNSGDTTLIIEDPEELDAALQDTVPSEVSGNVLDNDSFGADGPGRVVSVTYGDTTYEVPEGGSVDIPTDSGGTLTMHSNGDFTYSGPADVDEDITESFTYTMEDSDGDTSSATLNITVTDSDVPDDGGDNGGGHDDGDDHGHGHCPPFHYWIDHISLPHVAATFAGIWAQALAAADLLIDMGDTDPGINLSWKNCPDKVVWQKHDLFDGGDYIGEQLVAQFAPGAEHWGKLFTFTMKIDGGYEFELHNAGYFADGGDWKGKDLDFEWSLTDCEGKHHGGPLSVEIDTGTHHQSGTASSDVFASAGSAKLHLQGLDGNDTLHGGSDIDVLLGGGGDDLLAVGLGSNVLSGGAGHDHFHFSETDLNSLNTITDFEKGVDVIDLGELLSGEEAGNLSDYLTFSQDGKDTLLSVSPEGDGDGTQQIRFEDTNLMDLYGVTGSADLVQAMVDDQSLQVDKT